MKKHSLNEVPFKPDRRRHISDQRRQTESRQRAPFGQLFTHSIQRMHSVPFSLFLELSVTSTFIGHTRLHFPHEIHFSLLHVTRTSAK